MATIVGTRHARVDDPAEPRHTPVRPDRPRRRAHHRGRAARWPAHWPMTALFLGFPLWWVLGLRSLLPIALGFLMADQLLRRRRVSMPQGFAWWALFLVWVLLGVFVLFADAPGAVPGGHASRFVVFGYRAVWYFVATAALLWVATLRESELPTKWLFQLLGYMFVVTTLGGMLGVVAPHLEFRSALELVLPPGIRANGLVKSIVHPGVADYQRVLGFPLPRPKAPFPFSNTWGSSLALFLPFFVIAWWRDGRRWQRIAVPIIMVAALVPTVYSLNRGLWICLVAGLVGYVGLEVARRRFGPLLITVTLIGTLTIAFLLSPLGSLFSDRLSHGHSNERRGNLLTQTVVSALHGSPVVGFGSTRDVQGSFTSIAGGATPSCDACGVPPLGTQGTLWLVIFAEGFVGLLLFLAFFAVALRRSWACRTPMETACTFVLVFFAIQLVVYDLIGTSLLIVMIAIGAVWREQQAEGPPFRRRYDAGHALGELRIRLPFLAALFVIGAVVGAAVAVQRPIDYAARATVALTPVPTSLRTPTTTVVSNAVGGASVLTTPLSKKETTTVDTEAVFATSDAVLTRVRPGADAAQITALRRRLSVTAEANTRVMVLRATGGTPAAARALVSQVASSYLEARGADLRERRAARLRGVDSSPAVAPTEDSSSRTTSLLLTPTTAGRVLNLKDAVAQGRAVEVPITSGAAIGLALGALALALRPTWTPLAGLARRRRRPERAVRRAKTHRARRRPLP